MFPKPQIIFFLLFFSISTYAQVGINTDSPDPSSVLDVQFKTGSPKGMLTPRMSTSDRTSITTPADGLIVYDTDLKSFFYYSAGSSSWVQMNSSANGRTNFKRIKSLSDLAAEKTAGGGTKYLLNTSTYYEVNGTIVLDLPIDLNNAYLVGLDANEDVLVKTSGNLLEGANGGTVKNLTLSTPGATLFALNGANTQTLLFRDCIVANCGSVGTIQGFGFVFFGIIQYSGNTTGITYTNIDRLLLSNTAWLANNSGTFEKYTGTFILIQKQGGFFEVNGAKIGLDVSSNPTVATGVVSSVVFSGTPTTGSYVKPYTSGAIYPGYNFTNNWSVDSSGIPRESDAEATGAFSMDYPVGSGAVTTFSGSATTPTAAKKVEGNSTPTNLFRFSNDGGQNNRLKYLGNKKRLFQVTGIISYQVDTTSTWIVYIAKNGTVVSESKIYGRGSGTNDIVVTPFAVSVPLATNDYVEVWMSRYTANSSNASIVTPNLTLTIK